MLKFIPVSEPAGIHHAETPARQFAKFYPPVDGDMPDRCRLQVDAYFIEWAGPATDREGREIFARYLASRLGYAV